MKGSYIYKTKVPYVFIILMTFSAAFSLFMLSLMSPIKQAPGQGIDVETALWIKWGFMLPFIFMALACIWGFVGFKLIFLTSEELIIRRPLLMYQRRIDLSDIDRITEQEDNLNMSRGVFDECRLYSGKRATILFTSGKKTRISSIQITGYWELIEKTRAQMIAAKRQKRQQSF